MGSKIDVATKCIVVAKDYSSKSVMASVVPVKGASNEFPAKRISAFIREIGLEGQDLVLRSDQEPALQDLLAEVGRRRIPAKTFYEVSPVGSSASNGVAERGVQTVEGQIRVLRDAFETRVGAQIPSNHNILAWLVEFAGTVVNRYEVGRDGKTPFERLRGKQSRLIGLEFGEKVNFRRTAVGVRMAKLDSLWSDGVFLGYRSVSGEIVVGTESGVFKTRTVQRKAYEHRWHKQNMDMVGGVPWRASTSADGEEGIMPAVDIGMEMPEVDIPRAPKEDKGPVPRRLYIRAKDIERHGATSNCKGCIATLRGEGGVPHSDTCRKRLTEEIVLRAQGPSVLGRRVGVLKARDQESYHQAKRKCGGRGRSGEGRFSLEQLEQVIVSVPGAQRRASAEGVLRSYDSGGLWMIACREPEEDLEETQDEPVPIATEQGVLHEEFWDDRTGKLLDSEKVRAARAEELRELARVWAEADVEGCWKKRKRAHRLPMG